jgi:hypothetical protein
MFWSRWPDWRARQHFTRGPASGTTYQMKRSSKGESTLDEISTLHLDDDRSGRAKRYAAPDSSAHGLVSFQERIEVARVNSSPNKPHRLWSSWVIALLSVTYHCSPRRTHGRAGRAEIERRLDQRYQPPLGVAVTVDIALRGLN